MFGHRIVETDTQTGSRPWPPPAMANIHSFANGFRLLGTDDGNSFNRFLGADFRFQALPNLFDVWSDGMQLVIFEEFGAGTEAINHADLDERAQLLADPAYRKRFKRQWTNFLSPRVYHRDFRHSEVLACPDGAVVGKSFVEIAEARGCHVVDAFLDLVIAYGTAIRWRTTIANHRPKQLGRIAAHKSVHVGFADSGAHVRNMAFYNFPLAFLRLIKDAADAGKPLLPLGQAVHKLTGEQGGWYGMDAGFLPLGRTGPEGFAGRLLACLRLGALAFSSAASAWRLVLTH